jgi:sugar lactone lactonase YvrE
MAVLDKTGRLQVLEPDGTPRLSLDIVPGNVRRGHPIGVTWLPDGRLAVADTHSSRVRLIEPQTGEETVFGDYGLAPGEFLYPQRLAVVGNGELVISDHGMGATNRIQVVSIDGTSRLVFGGPAPDEGALVRPMGVMPLPEGGFLVADQRAGLVRFAADGALLGPAPGWSYGEEVLPYGLAQAADGTLYCSDLAGHRVLRLAADGTPTGVLGGEGVEPALFREPWDVAWHDGHLYVADMGNHRVLRFDAKNADWREP